MAAAEQPIKGRRLAAEKPHFSIASTPTAAINSTVEKVLLVNSEVKAMRLFTLILLVTAVAVGCSGQPPKTKSGNEGLPPEIAAALKGVGQRQAMGLNGAKVIVHRAYEYEGFSWIQPIKTARLVAVDVEFRNYDRGLDLDDVDIIDGQSNENFGSGPDIAHLTPNGKLAFDPYDSSWPENLGPLRVLLIYALPKPSKSIKLGYWGQEITSKPISIAGTGLSLPKPKPRKRP